MALHFSIRIRDNKYYFNSCIKLFITTIITAIHYKPVSFKCFAIHTTYSLLKLKHFVLLIVDLSLKTSIDVFQSKNQALYEYCTHVNKLKHC